MADIAIDTNILVKWVLPEADSLQAEAVAAAGNGLVALDIAWIEAANVFCIHAQRGLIAATEPARLFALLANRPVAERDSRPLIPQALAIAIKYRLTVYDALFVALTVERGIVGVTADAPLVRAVRADHPQIILLRNWTPSPPGP